MTHLYAWEVEAPFPRLHYFNERGYLSLISENSKGLITYDLVIDSESACRV